MPKARPMSIVASIVLGAIAAPAIAQTAPESEAASGESSWPSFRGPHGRGVSDGHALRSQLSDVRALLNIVPVVNPEKTAPCDWVLIVKNK